MVSRDYTKEIGVDLGVKKMRKRVAIPILAVVAAGVSVAVFTLVKGSMKERHAAPPKTVAQT